MTGVITNKLKEINVTHFKCTSTHCSPPPFFFTFDIIIKPQKVLDCSFLHIIFYSVACFNPYNGS